MWPTNATGGAVQLEAEATSGGRWQGRHRETMAGRAYVSLGRRDRRAEGTNGRTRGCTGRKGGGHYCSTRGGQRGGRPAACDLSESASGCRRSRWSGPCSLKEGAAGQRPDESSPKPSDQFGRIQRR